MVASRVTYNNLLSESWNNIKTLIDNRSNVSDPTTPSTEIRKWIYSREPDVKDISFGDFPYIIINPVSIDIPKSQSLDGKSGTVNFVCEVEIVTCDRSYGDRDGKGAQDCDAISNDVVETFNNSANKITLRTNGLAFSRINSTPVDVSELNNTLVYRRTIVLGLSARKRIST